MSEKLVQLTFCAKSSGLATNYIRITAASYKSGPRHLGGMHCISISLIAFVMIRDFHQRRSTVYRGHDPWALPAKFMKTKVHATNSLIKHNREIPEVVQWYIADRLLEPTERLNRLLEGKVSDWVDELQTIRGKTRPSWRILGELNRTVLAIPERLAYEAYHAVLDLKLWFRWRQFRRTYISDAR